MKYGLSEEQLAEICSIIGSYPQIEEAVIYGSRADGSYKEASDVDIAIKGEKADSSIASKLKFFLEEETYLPFFFDVIAYNANTSAALKKEIKTKGKTIYRKGWREVKLGDVAEIIGGGTPSTKEPRYWNGDIPWLTPKDLSNFKDRYIANGERNISKLGLHNSNAKLLPMGTVLLTTRAPVGYLAIAKNEIAVNQGFKGLIANKHIDNVFLYYLLKCNVDYLKAHSSGTTFGELSKASLTSISFCIPSLPEQKAIAEVLSSLDDKIDLLHRQNKTLENIAQTLFQKLMSGKARKGWREMKLGDASLEIIDGDRGQNYPKNEQFSSEGYCLFLNAKNVTKYGFNFSECCFITKEKDNKLKKGKLERNDIVLTTRGTVGNVAFYDASLSFEHIRINSGMVIVRPTGINPWFNFHLFKYLNKHFLNFASGSAQPQLPIKDLKEIMISLPPLPEQKAIAEVLSSLDDKIYFLHRQNKTLENMAQNLFQKLMSGQARVLK